MTIDYIPSVAVRDNAHLSTACFANDPLRAVLSDRLVVRDVVDQHLSSSIAVSLGDSSSVTALLRSGARNNLLQFASSIGQVDGGGAAGDQVPQLLNHKDLDFFGDIRGLVVLELHSERESGNDGDRGCSTSAHVPDSMPAICRASNLVVLFLVRQLQLVQDLKATRLVADCFEHHFEKKGRLYIC